MCRHVLMCFDGEMKDLRKWHHDLHTKVIASNMMIKTNDCKIECLKDDKKKLERAHKQSNDKNINLANGINKIENQRVFLEE